jgi:hypothetical protein|tara:strand:- start:1161 stop:1469 length:309 start_codon:yes stop_codon:yes gene_type:complete
MITDYDGCSGSGVCVPAVKAADAVPVGYIKPQSHPTAKRHHQVFDHNGDSNWTAVIPSPSSKSKLELNSGFLSFYPTRWFVKNCWFEPNHPSWLSYSKIKVA